MASALMIQNYIFGHVRWPWASDLYEYIQSVMLFPALLGVFANPRAPKFNVTAKGQTLEENHLSRRALPYFIIFSVVALSLVMLGIRFVDGADSRDLVAVVGVWTVFNLCLTGTALGAVSERRERRSTPRVAINSYPASLIVGAEETPVVIEDMSFGGLRVRLPAQSYVAPRVSGMLRIETGDPLAPSLDAPIVSSGRRVRNEEKSALNAAHSAGGRHQVATSLDPGWDKSADAIVKTLQSDDYKGTLAMLDERRQQDRPEFGGLVIVKAWAQYHTGDWEGARRSFADAEAKGQVEAAKEGLGYVERGYLPPWLR